MNAYEGDDHLVACHECDALFRRQTIPINARANCRRCGAELYRHIPDSLDRSLALYLTALMLWVMANTLPFLSMKIGGITEENLLLTGGWALYQFGMGELGLVVFLTSIAFPLVTIVGMLYLLIPIRLSLAPPFVGPVFRIVRALEPWSLVGVFMLGTLIAIVKLQDLARVIPGFALFAFAALLIVFSAARANFDREIIWIDTPRKQMKSTALEPGVALLNCHTCGMLHADHPHLHACQRCGSPIHFRIENSIYRTWALILAAVVMLVPANLYPVMTVIQLGSGQPDTIVSGIIHLIEAGLWGLGLILLFASIVVPFAKLTTLSFLLYSIQKGSKWRPRDRTLLYRVTEVIGAWSMVDVFLVALLSGLVSLGVLASVEPGIGATFFGAAVILTMLAAHSFDPRLIWDGASNIDDVSEEKVNKVLV